MPQTGDTSTSQLSPGELALRFLARTQAEVAQMHDLLPNGALTMEATAVMQIARIAHKISGPAELFGFPEIGALTAAIDHIAQDGGGRTVRERVELVNRLSRQIATLEGIVSHELAERQAEATAEVAVLPLSAHIPRFGTRGK